MGRAVIDRAFVGNGKLTNTTVRRGPLPKPARCPLNKSGWVLFGWVRLDSWRGGARCVLVGIHTSGANACNLDPKRNHRRLLREPAANEIATHQTCMEYTKFFPVHVRGHAAQIRLSAVAGSVMLYIQPTQSNRLNPTDQGAVMAVTVADPIKIIFAVLLPPLGVFLEVGLKGHFWLNILLTLLGFIPGIIHALYVILKH